MLLWEYVMAKEIEGQTLREYGRRKTNKTKEEINLVCCFLLLF